MAARAIVAERQSVALSKIRVSAAALSKSLGVDASALAEFVKGDPAYQEMVRTEQLAELLDAVRKCVEPKPETAQPNRVADTPVSGAEAPKPVAKAPAEVSRVKKPR